MTGAVNTDFIIAAAASIGADGAPTWIKVLPAGTFKLKDGRGPFSTRDLAHRQLVAQLSIAAAGNTELMIDYDHQSAFAVNPKVGGAAPAAGWIKQLEGREDGIWAMVHWTERAKQHISAGEYRYISPLFDVDDKGVVTLLQNAALVNRPAIDFAAIAASLKANDEDHPMKGIAKLLGLAETVTEAEIMAAIAGQRETLAAAAGLAKDTSWADIATSVTALVAGMGKVVVAAGLQAGAKVDDVVAAIANPGGAGAFVPKATFDTLAANFATFRAGVLEKDVAAAVEDAIAAGKVTPAQKDWATTYATRDLVDFKKFVAAAPVLTGSQLGKEQLGDDDDQDDPAVIAANANAYIAEEAKYGRTVSMAAAVVHVRDNPKKS